MTLNQQQAMRTARALLDLGHPLELILSSTLIPEDLRNFVRDELKREENFQLTPDRTPVADSNLPD